MAVPGSVIENTQTVELATAVGLTFSIHLDFSIILLCVLKASSRACCHSTCHVTRRVIPRGLRERTCIKETMLWQVAGQIARTAAIFNVDEVVVIDDSLNAEPGNKFPSMLCIKPKKLRLDDFALRAS